MKAATIIVIARVSSAREAFITFCAFISPMRSDAHDEPVSRRGARKSATITLLLLPVNGAKIKAIAGRCSGRRARSSRVQSLDALALRRALIDVGDGFV